ncbi:hypothetical protein BDR06DRAFT_866050, partial [Suillus hirtellus]
KGHYKMDCWQPGGGKEGQGPNQCQTKGKKQVATAATESNDNYVFAMSDLVRLASKLNIPPEHRSAIMDFSALLHFCPECNRFMNYMTIAPQDI